MKHSENLAHRILNSKSKIVSEFLWYFRSRFDIESMIRNHAVHFEDFDAICQNRLDGDYSYVLAYDTGVNDFVAILGRKDECDMDDDEEFDTHLLYSAYYATNQNFKQFVRHCRKYQQFPQFYVIDMFKVSKRVCSKYRSFNMQWHYENKAEEREEFACNLRFFKFASIMQQEHNCEVTTELICNLVKSFITAFQNYMSKIDSFEVENLDIELHRGKIYVSCSMPMYINSRLDKYRSINVVGKPEDIVFKISRTLPVLFCNEFYGRIRRNSARNFDSDYVVDKCKAFYDSKH